MEENTGQLFNHEVLLFIRDVLNNNDQGLSLSTHPVSAHGSTDRRTCLVPSIIVWDPLFQIFNGVLNCVQCGMPLKRQSWKDGHNSRNNPRILYCIEEPILLVSCIYACCKNHRVISHDERIIALCEEQVAPFVLLHKVGFTKKFMFYVVSHCTAGLNFRSIADTHSLLWQMATCMGAHSPSEDVKGKEIWMKCATRKTIAACFIYHYFLHARKYSTLMTTITGEWLSMDHTFKTAANIGQWGKDGRWRTMYDSVFLVMNEKKEVLSWVFAKTSGFIHVRYSLLKIKERINRGNIQLRGLVIDNCCQWRCLLHEVFGEIPVKLDLFHGVKRVTSTISKKDPFFHAFRGEFRMVFRDVSDRLTRREMPTPSPADLLKNFTKFKSQWELIPGSPIKNRKTQESLTKLERHIKNGCLSDIPPGIGTNINENIHKNLKKNISTNRKGVQSALASFGHFFYNWNQRRINGAGPVVPIELQTSCSSNFVESFGASYQNDNLQNEFACEQEELEVSVRTTPEIEDEEDSLAVLGITSDEIEVINSWAEHCITVQEKFKGHTDLKLAHFVFWSNFLHRLFEANPALENQKLDSLVSTHGLKLLISEDGSLLHAVLSSLQQIKEDLCHLKRIDLNIDMDAVATLRCMVKNEIANNEQRYYAFFEASTVNFDEWLSSFSAGDKRVEKFALPAVATVLQMPIIVFTSCNSFPVISVIPMDQIDQVESIPRCVLLIAYNRKDDVFCGIGEKELVEPQSRVSNVETEISCRCGQSYKREPNKTACDSWGKRCPCFRAVKGCSVNCQCCNCHNLHGKRDVTLATSTSAGSLSLIVPRKRQKTNMQSILQQSKMETNTMQNCPKELDGKVVVISVINFFISNGIPLDLDLLVTVASAVLGNTLRNITREELSDLTKYALNSFSTHASVIDAKF